MIEKLSKNKKFAACGYWYHFEQIKAIKMVYVPHKKLMNPILVKFEEQIGSFFILCTRNFFLKKSKNFDFFSKT